jgi:hypothetical protein
MADTVEAQEPQQGKTEQTQEKAQEVAGQAREKAQEAAGEARSRLREQVDHRSTQAGERIGSTGSDLRSVGQELRKQGKDAPARLADQAADRIERVGGYLADSDADRILRDVEDFGRRQPLAVLAGGMVLGIVAARFLKASSSRRYQYRTAGSNGANRPDHAQRTVSAFEAGTVSPAQGGVGTGASPAAMSPAPQESSPAATPDVRASKPDAGEHHQRFEGHG